MLNNVLSFSWVICVFLGFSLNISYAQDCAKSLKKAQKSYDIGDFEKVRTLINPCLESKDLTKKEKLQMYKLLTLVNVFDDEQDTAAYFMEEFLKLDPEYEINPSVDPVEFIELYNQFNTLPTISIGLTVGGSYTNATATQRYGLNAYDQFNHKYLGQFGGYQFGLKFNKYFSKRFSTDLEILFSEKSYEHQYSILNFADIVLDEKHGTVDVPVIFNYDFLTKKVKPYIGLGFSAEYLLSAEGAFSRTYSDTSLAPVEASDVLITNQRESFNVSAIVAAGVRFKIKRGMISIDMRYQQGLLNQVNTQERYKNYDLIYRYYYVDSDFLLNHYSVSVSYVYSLYNPKRKK
ncbi:MAG: PorT family protein [Cytophagales bacterium]|nr:PorT family protein [Cytophagales bacterium]